MSYGQGAYGSGPYGIGGETEGPLYRFEPPSHEEPMVTQIRPLNYYRLTWAPSIVRVNGVLTSVRSPNCELLEGLTEGVDYFMGGHVYFVGADVVNELAAAGYTQSIAVGYGLETYGAGAYGGSA